MGDDVPWPVGHVGRCDGQVAPGDRRLQGLTAAKNLTPRLARPASSKRNDSGRLLTGNQWKNRRGEKRAQAFSVTGGW